MSDIEKEDSSSAYTRLKRGSKMRTGRKKEKGKGGVGDPWTPRGGVALQSPLKGLHQSFPRRHHNRPSHDRGGWGGQSFLSLLGLLVGLPAYLPEPLLALLRAKIESKFTRLQVTRRLSNFRGK